jgi:hypothetical protein
MRPGHTELRSASRLGWLGRLRRAFDRKTPRARVTASATPRLGEPVEVEWGVQPVRGATLVTVSLVGCEIVRRRLSARTGITIVPERRDFCVVELDRRVPQAGSARTNGEGTALVPDGLVPSFAAKFNEVAWSIVVDVSFVEGPSARHEFPFELLPGRA